MRQRVTVRLPEELSRALKLASGRMLRPRSDIVRLALREYLIDALGLLPGDRVKGLIGSLEATVQDLAERRRAYTIESLQERDRG